MINYSRGVNQRYEKLVVKVVWMLKQTLLVSRCISQTERLRGMSDCVRYITKLFNNSVQSPSWSHWWFYLWSMLTKTDNYVTVVNNFRAAFYFVFVIVVYRFIQYRKCNVEWNQSSLNFWIADSLNTSALSDEQYLWKYTVLYCTLT